MTDCLRRGIVRRWLIPPYRLVLFNVQSMPGTVLIRCNWRTSPINRLKCLFFLAAILTEINISFTPKSLFTRWRRKMINGNVILLDPVFHHPAARSLSRCLSFAACLFTFQTVLLTVIYKKDNVGLIYSPKYENISFRGSFPRLFSECVEEANPFDVIQH